MSADRPLVFVQQPIPESARAELESFAEVDVFPHADQRISEDEAHYRMGAAEYIFALGENPITARMMRDAERLKLIAAMEIFPTQIDISAATSLGVPVSGLPHSDEITETTAEYTMALLLSVAWGIPRADDFLRGGHWAQYQSIALPAQRLFGKRLGIVGLGKIGRGVARRAGALGMTIGYHDIERRPKLEDELGIEWRQMSELIEESDIVVVCVLLTRETEDLFDSEMFAQMKPGALFVNTSRGRVVDEGALADALASGHLGGAGLDVYRHEIPEPNPGPGDSRLLKMNQVVLTPHIGTSARETRESMARHVVDCISRHLRGLRPSPVLNPEVYGESPVVTDRIG